MTADDAAATIDAFVKLRDAMREVEMHSAYRPHELWMSPRTLARIKLSLEPYATYPLDPGGPDDRFHLFGARVETSSRLADDVIIAAALGGKLNFAAIKGIKFVEVPKPPEPPAPSRTIADDMADLAAAFSALFTAITAALHLPQLVDWLARTLTRGRNTR